uniref:DUF4939 domain-containing protein n=1 Tax=Salarias fasciatus TaxID=181472 RepID=A0A672ILC2_SALFA
VRSLLVLLWQKLLQRDTGCNSISLYVLLCTVSAVAPPPAPVPAPVSLVFELQPLSYPSDRSRITYLIGLLSGPARAWGTALWENQSPACRTYQAFTEEMKRNFDHPVKGRDAGDSGVFLRRQEGRLSETLH